MLTAVKSCASFAEVTFGQGNSYYHGWPELIQLREQNADLKQPQR